MLKKQDADIDIYMDIANPVVAVVEMLWLSAVETVHWTCCLLGKQLLYTFQFWRIVMPDFKVGARGTAGYIPARINKINPSRGTIVVKCLADQLQMQ